MFGPNDQTKTAFKGLEDVAGSTQDGGQKLLEQGQQNTNSGANFFRNILTGNQANTSATLAPSVDRIKQANQGTLQAVSTLMPRGGGRSGTLFSLPFQINNQIQSLFNTARTAAAPALAQIGGGQTNSAGNMFQTAGQGYNSLGDLGQKQQEYKSRMYSQLGQGIFNLATMPVGGFGGTMAGVARKKLGGFF